MTRLTAVSLALAACLALACGDASRPPAGVRLASERGVANLAFFVAGAVVYTSAEGGAANRRLRWAATDGSGARTLLDEVLTVDAGGAPFFFTGPALWAWVEGAGGAELVSFAADGTRLGADAFVPGAVVLRGDGARLAGALPGGVAGFGASGGVAPLAFPVAGGRVPGRWGAAGFFAADAVVLAQPEGEAAFGLYRVDAATSAATSLVTGAVDGCEAGAPEPCRAMAVVGCGAQAVSCPDGTRPRCRVVYTRRDAAGARRPFVWEPDGAERALVDVMVSDEGFFTDPRFHTVLWRDPRLLEGGENRVWFLDGCSTAVPDDPDLRNRATCRVFGGPRVSLVFRPDGAAIATTLEEPGDVQVVDVVPGRCARVGTSRSIASFGFAPNSQATAWIDRSGVETSVWSGDGLGYGREELASGHVAPFFGWSPDARWVFLSRPADMKTALGAVDRHTDPPQERRLADAHALPRFGTRRVLLIADWNTQDRSGRLELVSLDGGPAAIIDAPVAAHEVQGDVDGTARVVFARQGRYPSAEDGLWLTTLPP